jgi:hypothetical protein
MIKDSKQLAARLPSYPRTPHLPYKPNTAAGDVVADESVLSALLQSPTLVIEEKVDGANCGVMLVDGDFVVRNRDHVLKKGYIKKDTPAKLQFRPIWNWVHENRAKFEKVNAAYGYPLGVYAEWMWAIHGIEYDSLPDYFVAFDLYDPERGNFIAPQERRRILGEAEFCQVPLLHEGANADLDYLEELCGGYSAFSSWSANATLREGIYLKDSDGTEFVTQRYKMVRPGYTQGGMWNDKEITRQKLSKS